MGVSEDGYWLFLEGLAPVRGVFATTALDRPLPA